MSELDRGTTSSGRCLASILAWANGVELSAEKDANLIADLEAATAVESNLITQVYECQVPGCEARGVANYHGEELIVESVPAAQECLGKFGSSMIMNASK